MNTLKEEMPDQKRGLRYTGHYLKRQGEIIRNTNPRLSVGEVTAKPANISIRESEGT
jgi:hypothetical protein